MQIKTNIQFIYDYEKDAEGVWHYTRTSKKIGTLYFNGKPFEELRGALLVQPRNLEMTTSMLGR